MRDISVDAEVCEVALVLVATVGEDAFVFGESFDIFTTSAFFATVFLVVVARVDVLAVVTVDDVPTRDVMREKDRAAGDSTAAAVCTLLSIPVSISSR